MLLLLTLAACTKDPETKKEIVLDKGTATEQTIFADQTSTSKGISFHADAPWFATVKEIATKATDNTPVDWITLSQYEGGSGDFTLTLTVKENHTQADRKAEISIICGTTVIKIMIEQKATKENGEEMAPAQLKIKTIRQYTLQNGVTAETVTDEHLNIQIDLKYDQSSRVVEQTWKEKTYEPEGPVPAPTSRAAGQFDIQTSVFEYMNHDVIKISDSKGKLLETIHLEKNGRAYSVNNYKLVYNSNNELIDADGTKMEWNGGNMTRCTWNDEFGDDNIISYSEVENNANIDLAYFACLYLFGTETTAFMHITEEGNILDCFGNRSKNMPSKLSSNKYADEETVFSYKTDTHGNITQIHVTENINDNSVIFIEYE